MRNPKSSVGYNYRPTEKTNCQINVIREKVLKLVDCMMKITVFRKVYFFYKVLTFLNKFGRVFLFQLL